MEKNRFTICANNYIDCLRQEGRYSTAHVYKHLSLIHICKEEQYKQVKQQAEVLTKARTKAAREVEKQLAARLIPLGRPNVRFQIEMGLKKEPGLKGEDTVNFLFSANKNGTLQNISSVASGGEIARVSLLVRLAMMFIFSSSVRWQ